MKIGDAYPSPFIKVEDLKGKNVPVLITSVKLEEVGQGRDKERKLIIAFSGKDKKFVCNKTNANTIAKLYGDDTDGWIAKWILLTPREVEFQGQMTWAIRVSLTAPNMGASQPAGGNAVQAPAPVPPQPAAAPPPDEDVPF